jgi:kinesin family protein 1
MVKAQTSLDPGSFFLRQGLQRKLALHLSHDSGRQFKWTKVTKVELGNVRLLDSRGRMHGAKVSDSVQLKVPSKQQTLEFRNNGTGELDLWAWWDSSVHDSLYLNRTTANGHRVLISLRFEVEVESCAGPVPFSMDIAVSVNARDAKPPGRLMSFIESATSGSKTLTKASAIFSVRLMPPMTKKTAELWRLDTAKKYVRGQETLRGWKARGPSLVKDHAKLVMTERKRAEVEGVRALLRAHPPLSLSMNGSTVHSNGQAASDLLERAISLWQRAVYDTKMQVIVAEQPSDVADSDAALALHRLVGGGDSPASSASKLQRTGSSTSGGSGRGGKAAAEVMVPKLTAEVTLVARSDNAAKRGWLEMPVEAFTDHWSRRWFALRRPFLYVYETNAEVDEIMAINVAAVRVEHDENIQRMLDRPHVFSVYTSSNSYFLQAASEKEMHAWMVALDSLYEPSGLLSDPAR